jgi:NAD(P)-dependent dehydrogenase (short-subunit alcohol dehydrogenase family)
MRHGAVIVGGTGAIGRQVVRQLTALGVPVALTYTNRHDVAETLLAEAAALGTPASACAIDLADPDAPATLLAHARQTVTDFDILVNCAGRNIRQQMHDVTARDWDEVHSVNLYGVFTTCRMLGEHMAGHGRGAIVTLTSTAAIRPLKRSPHYIAAKAGLLGLTQYFAACLAPQVIVNAVMPGPIVTATRPDGHGLEHLLPDIPLARLGDVDSVVRAVLFLSDPDLYITGQVITVDGGLTL